MLILTSRQMSYVDRITVERTGISYQMLMETAGVRVVEAVGEYIAEQRSAGVKGNWRIVVVCGQGNNGGDGAVAARHLWLRQLGRIEVFLIGKIEMMKGEARVNAEIVRSIAAIDSSIAWAEVDQELPEIRSDGERLIIIDAMFGTGLRRRVEGTAAQMIARINDLRGRGALVVSIDLPSGLDADSGGVSEPHVRADLTVALTAPKIANVVQPAAAAGGRLVVAHIGTPSGLIAEASEDGISSQEQERLELAEERWVAEWLEASRRTVTAHKGMVGKVLLLAGSPGRTGAAALAAGAALRVGAGLVTVGTSASALPLLVSQCDSEVMTQPLPETPGGGLTLAGFSVIEDGGGSWDLVGIGPGLRSEDSETRGFVRAVVEGRAGPVVIDADGLNALAPWPHDLSGELDRPIIITPHPGEMSRLTERSIEQIQADPIGVARTMAKRHQLIVVLKGARTIIAEPSGRVVINPTGNEGMATAGSGDVLTGMLTGLLAQRPRSAIEAVIAGVWLHGLAGDLAASKLGLRFMRATDIREQIGEAIIASGGTAEIRGMRRSL